MNTKQELPTAWSRDSSTFDAMYVENAPRIRAFLRQLVGSRQAAEDVTQEIFTQLWQRPGGFDPDRGTLRAYLFGVARHRAAEWWRRSRPENAFPEDSRSGEDPERGWIIADALQHLPEEQRMLLWLREVEGQSYAELASILNIPLGTVRSRLFTARQALRVIWVSEARKGDLHEVR
ncbi:RNA polymerase sigma-70 factor (ECF subfamily) [Granulicella aggregans]|uniref:RNA polymerase sigma-70 factor (ECF subfamily) n=1 Tax=Granulicella aggregans TaxID=474949 RepID=A0A7W8E6S5_9BACT|nr:sigma-70 family RNA polymerase sigma factor [Granulicella aggregans]MBB5060976.1 RNA polymerase sigma-70 factor (ECF subfamily) [Granulicella aggregans]